MILYVEIVDLALKKRVEVGIKEVQITNSFVPENMWAESSENDYFTQLKVQQCFNCKFEYNYNGVDLTFFLNCFSVLDNEYGEIQYLSLFPVCLRNGYEDVNIKVDVIYQIENFNNFIIKDYSKLEM